MGKYESGYARVPRDLYPTPPWVTAVLTEHVDTIGKHILEPACGDGRMSEALIAAGARVYSTDIADHGYAGLNELLDFTALDRCLPPFDGIITNPPFGDRSGRLAEAFIRAGLHRMGAGFLALLLPANFDSAKTRPYLFGDCSHFVGKIVLCERVVWFKRNDGKREQPKENSAWYLWGNVELRKHNPRTRRQLILRYATDLDARHSRARLPTEEVRLQRHIGPAP